MENKDLKKILGQLARDNNYETAIGIWYKESSECIVTFSLQKSNYGNYFYLNLKIFVNGIFGEEYKINKKLKNDTGDIFTRSPKEFDSYLNLEINFSESERIRGLERLFSEFINPFAENALTIGGILRLEKEGKISILPAVKKELEKIDI